MSALNGRLLSGMRITRSSLPVWTEADSPHLRWRRPPLPYPGTDEIPPLIDFMPVRLEYVRPNRTWGN